MRKGRHLYLNLSWLQRLVREANITITQEGNVLIIQSPLGEGQLEIVSLYRASVQSVLANATPKRLLVLSYPSQKAIQALEQTEANYLCLDNGACRLIVNGSVILQGRSRQY